MQKLQKIASVLLRKAGKSITKNTQNNVLKLKDIDKKNHLIEIEYGGDCFELPLSETYFKKFVELGGNLIRLEEYPDGVERVERINILPFDDWFKDDDDVEDVLQDYLDSLEEDQVQNLSKKFKPLGYFFQKNKMNV